MLNEAKRGRPTEAIKDYMLRVRLADTDMRMLDILCKINDVSRSQMIRLLIVESIYQNYYELVQLDEKQEKIALDGLRERKDILEIMEELNPTVDEIDVFDD